LLLVTIDPMKKIKTIIRRVLYSDCLFGICEFISYMLNRNRIKRLGEAKELQLHIGSGSKILNGWINIDGSLNLSILTMRMPEGLKKFTDESVCAIYASHFLEHIIYPEEAVFFAKECYRVLVSGGVLRIVVPDIERIINAYVENDSAFFDIQATMHPKNCTTKLEHLMYALQQHGEHEYGYDFETMQKLLFKAGFKEILRSDYKKSNFPCFCVDYRAESDNKGRNLSLYVDAIK